MAKKSAVNRNLRVQALVKQYAAKRTALKAVANNEALPRVKDFRGLRPTSFDGRGNYALGLREHIVFPEINYDEIDQIWGMDIIVCTTAKTDDEARALLKGFDMPFTN